jgi:CheY-like chemotaxis protein
MIGLGNVLIADDSDVYIEVMATVMAPYCDALLTAASGDEAVELIGSGRKIDLILCDLVMKNGDGYRVLEHVATMDPAEAPKVVMVTAFPSEQAADRTMELGATAYLTKPTTVREILSAVGVSGLGERREPKQRWRCIGTAHLVEDELDSLGYVTWDVYNLSPTGAFLETKGPLPVGAQMDLLIVIGARKARVTAEVVRVQEPSWIDVGGVGVKFVGPSEELQTILDHALEAIGPADGLKP